MALLLPARCGSVLYSNVHGKAARPPAEVFECVRNQISVLGYTQTSYDVHDRRLTARQYDFKTKIADTTFRRMIERLNVEIKDTGGGGAELQVQAHTFAEYFTD